VVPGVCYDCYKKRTKIKGSKCAICADELQAGTGSGLCARCDLKKPSFEKHFNRYQYEGPIREIVLLYKTEKRYPLARVIGGSIAREVTKYGSCIKFDFVTYIPGSWKRKLWRRFLPAELIAKAVSEKIQVPLKGFLTLRKDVRLQKGLTAGERRENVRGAFGCSRVFDRGEKILVIDDIFTTGATIEEASAVLKANGAVVYAATFAMAGKRSADLIEGKAAPETDPG